MIISKENILQYIPQRPPMVMVDAVLEATEKKIKGTFTIKKDNIFVENNLFSESGLIEHVAQVAAAGLGYNQISKNLPVQLGFIAAIKTLEIHSLPSVGSQLVSIVEVVNEVMDVTIVKAQASDGEKLLVECELRIFTQK